MNLARFTHLPSRAELLSTKRPRCVVCITEKNISMKPGTHLHVQPMSKTFICACVNFAVHVQSGIHLNSKWHLFPNLCEKSCFEILHSKMYDRLRRSKLESA